MVTTQKALIASGISAAMVGAIHYVAHQAFAGDPDVVMKVGVTVVASVFIIGFYGMTQNG